MRFGGISSDSGVLSVILLVPPLLGSLKSPPARVEGYASATLVKQASLSFRTALASINLFLYFQCNNLWIGPLTMRI